MKLPMRLLLAALVLVAVPVVAQESAEPFTVDLPEGFGELKAQTQKSESPEGIVETTNWISKAQNGEVVVVTVSKMPGHILNPEKLIESTRDSLLKSLKATLEIEQKVDGETPATLLQFHSASANPVYLQSQLMVDDDRLYQLLYVAKTPEQRASATVDELFESFRVAAPAPAPVAAANP